MKNQRITFLLSFCLSLAIAWGETPPAKTVFAQYMNQAQTFANNFPREKTYLHFANTSYYVGDTIWFQSDQPHSVCRTGGPDMTYSR